MTPVDPIREVEGFWEYLRVNLEAEGSEHPYAADSNRALFYRLCRDYFQEAPNAR